jgi:aspartate aminotransferase-like enzyme
LQAEATVALEAVARGIGRAGATVLNVVSGPYGGVFGAWLNAAGAEVVEVSAPWRGAVSPSATCRILEARRDIDVVSLVHAQAATGNKNALEAIADITTAKGVLLVVDAVASVGAEPLDIDQWGIDLCVVGPQKGPSRPGGRFRRHRE